MWIAIGLIVALWVVGAIIAPDKNAPPSDSGRPAAAQTAQQTPEAAPRN
jgi:hypothetical protein